ncbi:MAG TPA: hypothetical protein V6D12_17570 [Candidatus Obscuribacterales bacterium]
MFPFWDSACHSGEPISRRSRLERKLRFLQLMRDDLETRLAGVNAAISKIEEQLSEENAA